MKRDLRTACFKLLGLASPLLVMSAGGQATAPKVLRPAQTSVQQDVPGHDAPLQDKPSALDDNTFRASVVNGNALSARLADATDLLAIIMTQSDLQKLLQYEDTQFGVIPSVDKLNHRRNALRTAITQLKATSK